MLKSSRTSQSGCLVSTPPPNGTDKAAKREYKSNNISETEKSWNWIFKVSLKKHPCYHWWIFQNQRRIFDAFSCPFVSFAVRVAARRYLWSEIFLIHSSDTGQYWFTCHLLKDPWRLVNLPCLRFSYRTISYFNICKWAHLIDLILCRVQYLVNPSSIDW